MTARLGGGSPMSSVAVTGGRWAWVTMLRSWWTAIEVVTGECQPSKRRERLRSTSSCSASASQQKSA